MRPLAGQVALVTGCLGRLGPVWIRALEDAGARVLGVDQADWDLSFDAQVRALAAEEWGQIDILVNNAGVDSRPDGTGNQMAAVQVNVLATSRLCELFGQQMAERGHGAIVNIASLYGLIAPDMRYYDHRLDGWVKDPIYGATKAAIISLTQYWAARLGPKGVRVNAIAPGGVVDPADPLTAQDPAFIRKYTDRIPLGRMCQPSDLAGPLVFLASEASSFMTGQTLVLDGGMSAW